MSVRHDDVVDVAHVIDGALAAPGNTSAQADYLPVRGHNRAASLRFHLASSWIDQGKTKRIVIFWYRSVTGMRDFASGFVFFYYYYEAAYSKILMLIYM